MMDRKPSQDIPTALHLEHLVPFLEDILSRQIDPDKLTIFQCAFTHSTLSRKRISLMERLEFLGDSLLGFTIAELLYHEFPAKKEGALTKLRSSIVNRKFLNQIGANLQLSNYLLRPPFTALGKDIQGNLLETLIGAIYIAYGIDVAKDYIKGAIWEKIDWGKLQMQKKKAKTRLLELEKIWGVEFQFQTIDTLGQDHKKIFRLSLCKNGAPICSAEGPSKKITEEFLAEDYLTGLGVI